MRIVVAIKQVLDPRGFTVNRKAEKIFVNREEYVINPADKCALEAALQMAGDVSVRRSTALGEAEAALRQLVAHPERDAARAEASHALARVRYFTRFLEEVDAMEEEALEG